MIGGFYACSFFLNFKYFDFEIKWFKMFFSSFRCSKWDDDIIATFFENSMDFLKHWLNILIGLISTKEDINSWFINYKIKELRFIRHFSDIHYFIDQRWTNKLILSLHLFNHRFRNIIIPNFAVSLIKHIFTNRRITTTNIQNFQWSLNYFLNAFGYFWKVFLIQSINSVHFNNFFKVIPLL